MSKTRQDLRDGLAEVIRDAESHRLPAKGVSMGGVFAEIDGLLLRGARHARPRHGSVVLFQREHLWVAHRVILRRQGPRGEEYLTRGDANALFDHPWVTADDLLAEVTGVVRDGRDHPFGARDRLAGTLRWLRGLSLLLWRRLSGAGRPGAR